MTNKISRRLQLLALVLIVMMGAYGVFMYYSAKQADFATDIRNEKLVMGLFASHANRISNLVASRAVSDNSYDAILGGNLAQTMKTTCNASNKDGLSVSFAVFGDKSGLKYLCEYGQSKNISEHQYLTGIFEEKSQDLIAKVNDVTRTGFVPAGEFIHEHGYFEFHNLPYLYVIAAMVPETDTARVTDENHYYLALHNLRGKFRQISADFLPIQHRGDKKAELRQKNEFTTEISVGEKSGVKIGWPALRELPRPVHHADTNYTVRDCSVYPRFMEKYQQDILTSR